MNTQTPLASSEETQLSVTVLTQGEDKQTSSMHMHAQAGVEVERDPTHSGCSRCICDLRVMPVPSPTPSEPLLCTEGWSMRRKVNPSACVDNILQNRHALWNPTTIVQLSATLSTTLRVKVDEHQHQNSDCDFKTESSMDSLTSGPLSHSPRCHAEPRYPSQQVRSLSTMRVAKFVFPISPTPGSASLPSRTSDLQKLGDDIYEESRKCNPD